MRKKLDCPGLKQAVRQQAELNRAGTMLIEEGVQHAADAGAVAGEDARDQGALHWVVTVLHI
jgi:hypothetical protein